MEKAIRLIRSTAGAALMLAAIYAGWHGDYLVSSLAFLLGLENFELAERESTPDMVTG